MKTYETNEGIIYCSNCGTALNDIEIENDTCNHCWQVENGDMSDETAACQKSFPDSPIGA